MTKEEIIDNIARLNSATWRDREEVRIEIGTLIAELRKALEQEPCEDAISRKEVKKFVEYIQTIKDNHNEKGSPINYGTICDIVINAHKLLDLPPVTPTQEWIPCSDGLPLERNAVLVWSINNTYCAYLEDGKWYIFGAYDWELKEVTAWMPLPKPYKGGNKDENKNT